MSKPFNKPFRKKGNSGKRSFGKQDDSEREPAHFKEESRSDDAKPPFRRDKPFEKKDSRGKRPLERKGDTERTPFRKDRQSDDAKKAPFRKDKPFEKGHSRGKRSFDKKEGAERTPFKRDSRSNDAKPPFRRDKPFEKGDGRSKRPFEKKEYTNREDAPFKKDNQSDNPGKDSFRRPERHDGKKKFWGKEKRGDDSNRAGGWKDKEERGYDKKQSENYGKPYKKKPFKKFTIKPTGGSKSFSPSDDGRIRLNKYIANTGVCSRREADELITSGAISVNGKVVTELGFKVLPTDVVNYGGETLRREKLVYVLLNKPKDYISTVDDPQKRRTVLDLIQGACKERIYPVGRLDRNTTGVLLLTNDGDLTKKLTHPSHGAKKMYHVVLDNPLKSTDFETIMNGLELEDGPVKADELNYVGDGNNKREVGIALHSGRNRVVRRIFEQLGYRIDKLDRVYFAGLTKKDLQRGHWRFLSEKEVGFLKMNTK